MADEFRRLLDKTCGRGGVHCSCCNDFDGRKTRKKRRIHKKQVRSILKRATENLVNESLLENEDNFPF